MISLPPTVKRGLSFVILAIIILFCMNLNSSCNNLSPENPNNQVDDRWKKIDEVVSALYKNGQFSGVVLVADGGGIIYAGAVGYSDIKKGVLNTCDTKFRIASFTKAFTTLLILQLSEEGKIDLDGKVSSYLPEFPKELGDRITIRQLITHRAGITGEGRVPNLLDIEKEYYTRERLMETIASYDLVFEPGRNYEYSNWGFSILGFIIEAVTRMTYDDVLKERVCIPAGMKNTLSDINQLPIENRAIGYTHNYFTGPEEASLLDMSFAFGGGQLLSTVYDLFLFDRALYTNILLKQETKELFFEYGWRYQDYPYANGKKRIRSNNLEGSCNGFQSHTQRIEKDTIFIVALRNIKEAVYENQIVIKWPSAIASPILSILYGEEYGLPKKSAAYEVFMTLISSDKKEAQEKYYRLKTGNNDEYYYLEEEFPSLYKVLIENGRIREANDFQRIYSNPEISNIDQISGELLDIDNNKYKTIKIGEQWWMGENLKVRRNPVGETIGSYYYYDDSLTYAKFGRLYTWNVAMNEIYDKNSQGICPDGWHIPSEKDWDKLFKFLGGEEMAGAKMSVNGSSGFNAILSGGADADGNYLYFEEYAMYWSSTSTNGDKAYHMG